MKRTSTSASSSEASGWNVIDLLPAPAGLPAAAACGLSGSPKSINDGISLCAACCCCWPVLLRNPPLDPSEAGVGSVASGLLLLTGVPLGGLVAAAADPLAAAGGRRGEAAGGAGDACPLLGEEDEMWPWSVPAEPTPKGPG